MLLLKIHKPGIVANPKLPSKRCYGVFLKAVTFDYALLLLTKHFVFYIIKFCLLRILEVLASNKITNNGIERCTLSPLMRRNSSSLAQAKTIGNNWGSFGYKWQKT